MVPLCLFVPEGSGMSWKIYKSIYYIYVTSCCDFSVLAWRAVAAVGI